MITLTIYIISLIELLILILFIYIHSVITKDVNFISIKDIIIGITAFIIPVFNIAFFLIADIGGILCIIIYLKEYNIIPINKWLEKLRTITDKDVIRIGKTKK